MKLSAKTLKVIKHFYNENDFRNYIKKPYYIKDNDAFLVTDGVKLLVIAHKEFDLKELSNNLIPINVKYIEDAIKNKEDLVLDNEFVKTQDEEGLFVYTPTPNFKSFLSAYLDDKKLHYDEFCISAKEMQCFLKIVETLNSNRIKAFNYKGSSTSPCFEAICDDLKVFCVISRVIV